MNAAGNQARARTFLVRDAEATDSRRANCPWGRRVSLGVAYAYSPRISKRGVASLLATPLALASWTRLGPFAQDSNEARRKRAIQAELHRQPWVKPTFTCAHNHMDPSMSCRILVPPCRIQKC